MSLDPNSFNAHQQSQKRKEEKAAQARSQASRYAEEQAQKIFEYLGVAVVDNQVMLFP